MSQEISEREWKILRELKPIALDRFCQRVLAEVDRIATDTSKGDTQRYLAVFTLIRQRDDELANAFDDLRRTTALRRLACIKFSGLLTN